MEYDYPSDNNQTIILRPYTLDGDNGYFPDITTSNPIRMINILFDLRVAPRTKYYPLISIDAPVQALTH